MTGERGGKCRWRVEGGGRRQCMFQLLRYAPDPLRNEYVHIGAILRSAEPATSGQPEVRFTHDWRRVRCLDPDADTAQLEGLESEWRRKLSEDRDGQLMRILTEALSLNVQLTDEKAFLVESLPAGMDELMRLYVDSPKRARSERLQGRSAVHAQMRREFEHAGVWDLMRKRIAASEYTRPGDPLRIDAGYRVNGASAKGPLTGTPLIRMFHAVSMEPGGEMAKVLAFSAAGLRAGVERAEAASLELTAVIEPASRLGATEAEPDRLALYRFGVETMEDHAIRVLTTADLGRAAETARRELHV